MANIVVAFRKIEDAKSIRSLLVRNGFDVTAVCASGTQAISRTDTLRGGILICGYKLQDMVYSELYDNMPEDFQMLLMARADLLPSLQENNIVCLSMPAKLSELLNTVAMLEKTVDKAIRKKRAARRNRSKEDEEVISQAKALLMDRNNMTEPEAHRYIQKTAMDTGTGFVETAHMILDLYR